MVRVRWWGIASSVLAPVLIIGGWTAGADLQPVPFDAVSRSISTLAALGMPYRWVVTLAILSVGVSMSSPAWPCGRPLTGTAAADRPGESAC